MKESNIDKELIKIDKEIKRLTQKNEELDRKIRDMFKNITNQNKTTKTVDDCKLCKERPSMTGQLICWVCEEEIITD